jgi:hypothetical protein
MIAVMHELKSLLPSKQSDAFLVKARKSGDYRNAETLEKQLRWIKVTDHHTGSRHG